MALTKTQISELYVSIFNRASEKSGSQNWLNSGYNTDATTMANAMLATDAAKTYFGTSLVSDAAFVEHIYKNTLNKGGATVDAAGKAGWVEFLATGKSRGEMVAKMIEAIKEYQVGGAKYATADQTTKDAAQQFANRVDVSDYTADTLETIAVSEINSTLSFSGALNVTADPATVTTAEAKVAAAAAAANKGRTYELTSGTDKGAAFVGTDKNDFFDASIAQNSFTGGVSNTLSSADKLDGGAGTDTLHAEIVAEFVGATASGYQIDVQPQTKDIEIVTFEARDAGGNGTANTTVTVDAKYMYGVEKIGSKFSDGDLVIENLTTLADDGVTIRNTSDMTITMDHTDNFNSDNDASDLTVLFDEDYLNTTTSSQGSSLTLNINNAVNIKEGTNPVDGFATINFTVGTVDVAVDVRGATSYADIVTKINAQLSTQGLTTVTATAAALKDVGFSQDTKSTDGLTTYPALSLAGQYNPIIIANSGSETLVKGVISLAQGTVAGDINNTWNSTAASTATAPIATNVELTKVGRDGEGGDLVIGGKDQGFDGNTDVDKNDGIEVFNITVKGDATKPSNLGSISSTNNKLTTVNITTDAAQVGTYAALTITDAFNGTNASLSDSNATNVEVVNASGLKGALSIGATTAMLNVDTFVGSATAANTIVANIDGTEQAGTWTVTTGSAADTLTQNLVGDAVDTIGESFSVSTNDGADTVTLKMDATPTVSFQTMAALKNLNISTGNDADTVNLDAYGTFNITTGEGSDFVRIDSVNDNGNAKVGTWTVGDVSQSTANFFDAKVLYNATLTLTFAGFEQKVAVKTDAQGNFTATQATINAAIKEAINTNPELSKLLTVSDSTGNQAITISSTVGGDNSLSIAIYQPQLVASTALVSANGQNVLLADADLSAIRQGLINTTALNSDVLTTVAAVVTATDALNSFYGSVAANGTTDEKLYSTVKVSHDTAELVGDDKTDIFDASANYVAYSNGGSSDSTTGINFSTIDLGNGANDVVVLHSNNQSANVIKISGSFGKNSIVNFHDVSTNNVDLATEVGFHALDFSTFLTTEMDPSSNAVLASNTQSKQTIATTVNIVPTAKAFADSVAGVNTAAANSVNVLRFDSSIDSVETFASLTSTNLVSALNATTTAAEYGNLTDTLLSAANYAVAGTTLIGTTQDHIIMVENDLNEGEYKVFHVTSTVNADGTVTNGDFANAVELGTLDFGASVNLNVTGTAAWSTLIGQLTNGAETFLSAGTQIVDPGVANAPVTPTTPTQKAVVLKDADEDTASNPNTIDASGADYIYTLSTSGNDGFVMKGFAKGDTIDLSSHLTVILGTTATGIEVGYYDALDFDPAGSIKIYADAALIAAVDAAADFDAKDAAISAVYGDDWLM